MRYLLDSGILIRMFHERDPSHDIVRGAVGRLLVDGNSLVTTRQNIAEFWNVCTRPVEARGGLGLSTAETRQRLHLLEAFVLVLPEPATVYSAWKSLIIQHEVKGKQVHDARIAAAMIANRVGSILTMNDGDFRRYAPVLKVWTPADFLSRDR